MSGFLLDTTVLSELIKPKPDAKVVQWVEGTDESIFFLSVLTLGEIRNGIARLRSRARQERLETWLRVDLRGRFKTGFCLSKKKSRTVGELSRPWLPPKRNLFP
jgi:hypothetical protein